MFIPVREVGSFDRDDRLRHATHFIDTPQGPTSFDCEGDFQKHLAWYRGYFADAREGQACRCLE